jgi:hypothetical protein
MALTGHQKCGRGRRFFLVVDESHMNELGLTHTFSVTFRSLDGMRAKTTEFKMAILDLAAHQPPTRLPMATMTTTMTAGTLLLLLLSSLVRPAIGLNIVVAGGTGSLGRMLIPQMVDTAASMSAATPTKVTILTRNSFLASTPTRVSEDYGHLGKAFVEKFQKKKNLTLRDWDGGDLLDIVGRDWMGWQRDVLPKADVILHLTGGGFTEQRVMACERLVRESLKHNKSAHHITVNPSAELLAALSPGLKSVKTGRIERCEAMVRENCQHYTCLRIGQRDLDVACQTILDTLAALARLQQQEVE